MKPINEMRAKIVEDWLEGKLSTASLLLSVNGIEATRKYIEEGGKSIFVKSPK